MSYRRSIGGLAGACATAAMLAVVLVGCSGDGVATLRGKDPAELTYLERTKLMAACLEDFGLRTEVNHRGANDELSEIMIESDEPFLLDWGPGVPTVGGPGNLSNSEWMRAQDNLDQLAAKYDPSRIESSDDREVDLAPAKEIPYLFIGQDDFTEAFTKCLSDTGYKPPGSFADPATELAQKQLALQSTVYWLKCARENGYPLLKDPPPPQADNWASQPTAVLPPDITPDALRSLLTVCPAFNQSDYEAGMQEMTDHPKKYSGPDWAAATSELLERYPGYIEPTIGFGLPGYDGRPHDSADGELSAPQAARLAELQEILNSPAEDYWQELLP
jgi:hypothetical protein